MKQHMFKIRDATIEDIPLIRQLTFNIWPQTYAPVLSQQQIDYMLDMMYSEAALKQQMTGENCRFIIVYDDETPVGFASFSEITVQLFKLHKIYILSSQQGKGTGRFVIDHIINQIQQQGATALQLQVNRYNKAKTFYEKLGFVVIKEADFDIGHGYFMNDYVMEKKLTIDK
jgi:diamine N-acetyltransferase